MSSHLHIVSCPTERIESKYEPPTTIRLPTKPKLAIATELAPVSDVVNHVATELATVVDPFHSMICALFLSPSLKVPAVNMSKLVPPVMFETATDATFVSEVQNQLVRV